MKTIVEAAYNAYQKQLRAAPKWEDLSEGQQKAWRHAIVEAVETSHCRAETCDNLEDLARVILQSNFEDDQIEQWLANTSFKKDSLVYVATTKVWENVLS